MGLGKDTKLNTAEGTWHRSGLQEIDLGNITWVISFSQRYRKVRWSSSECSGKGKLVAGELKARARGRR